MRLFRPCPFTVWFFPEALFRKKTTEKILYLTFDDGPDPLSTPVLLNLLARFKIRAVFFCSGKPASEIPELIDRIKSEGHIVGNHGYDHLNGLFTSKQKYLSDVRKASEYTSDNLFRPPYGRIRISQYRELIKSYRIILWDIMPFDFDWKFGSQRSLSALKRLIRPGSVIVLHDTTNSTLHEFLEEFILFATGEGYHFTLP